MAIAVDNVTEDVLSVDRSSATFAHTCTGSNLVLIVTISTYDSDDANRNVNSVTYDGVALTKLSRENDDNDNIAHDVWYLGNPATGSNNVIVTWNELNVATAVVAHSYTGASGSISNYETHLHASPDISESIITTAANSWVIAGVTSRGADMAPFTIATGVEQWDGATGISTVVDASYTGGYTTTTTTGSYEWRTTASTTDSSIILVFELLEAEGASSQTVQGLQSISGVQSIQW